MERELIFTGIGGQGVQLGANILAKAAVLEGKMASVLAIYGGEMRGGPITSTIVFSTGDLEAPPLVAKAWSIIVMHPRYWKNNVDKVGGFVLYNQDLAGKEHQGSPYEAIPMPATSVAKAMGDETVASMIAIGAYAKMTGLVSIDAIKQVMRASIPAYRQQRVAANEKAIDAGYAMTLPAKPAWTEARQKEVAL
jgi:2-oxoacid:acceptor oxidoreductase gamma subunit (pyruvate/2-ketoisovalerate family)